VLWYTVGFPGNLLSLAVWIQPRMRHSSGCYLAALAAADFLFLPLHLQAAFSALTLLVGRPVKTEWWGAGAVICLERGADLHAAQLTPLPLTISCY